MLLTEKKLYCNMVTEKKSCWHARIFRWLPSLYERKNICSKNCSLSFKHEVTKAVVRCCAVCMEKNGRRLLAELCTWKNMVEGCWLSYAHERI